jgi:putative membrane protein
MTWMGIWWLLGAALIAVLVWALLRVGRGPMGNREGSPEEILKRRYAKGEIDRETFERMRTELRGG